MLRRSLLAAPLLLAASPARAEWTPRRPIHVLVGTAPGGTADIAARLCAGAIQRRAGYNVVVENRTGNLGFIALRSVAQAAPDGYTLGLAIMGTMAVAPVVPGSQIGFDLDKDLLPLCNLAGVPMVLVIRKDAPFKTVPELIAYAKANPGKVSYASTGNGSTNQLGAEFFAAEFGRLELLHVPYRGGAPAAADLAAGQVDMMFANISEVISMITSGQVRALALAATHPSPMAPDLPLLTRELPALDINNWFGLVGPAGLPKDIAQSLTNMFMAAMADPEIATTLASRGMKAIPEDGPAFTARIKRDRERWARVVAQGNIRAD